MKIEEIKNIARQHRIPVGRVNIRELVRAIQKAEGHTQCFDTNNAGTCGQLTCLWREDCD